MACLLKTSQKKIIGWQRTNNIPEKHGEKYFDSDFYNKTRFEVAVSKTKKKMRSLHEEQQ